MSNMASAESGAVVVGALSQDSRHLPSNMIDGNEKTFWVTTGMFPQEFIITFPNAIQVSSIKISSKGLKTMKVMRCEKQMPVAFEDFETFEFEDSLDVRNEHREPAGQGSVVSLKFVITAGYQDFGMIRSLEVLGRPV